MTDKLRVKDISAELGISNKELLQACRELDIPVKSHMSTLEDEDASAIRGHVKKAPTSTEVVTKEVQPGAVVRRRRKKVKAPNGQAEAEAKPEIIPEPQEEPAEAAAKVPETVAEEAKPEAPEIKKPVAKKKAKRPETPAARIVKPVVPEQPEKTAPTVDEAPKAEEAAPETPEAPVAEAAKVEPEAKPTAKSEETAEAVSPEPEAAKEAAPEQVKTAPTEAKDKPEAIAKDAKTDAGEKTKVAAKADGEAGDEPKKKKKKKEPIAPKVKIISRPDPALVQERRAAAATARPSGGRPGGPGGRPGGPGGRPGGPGGRPGGPGGRPGGPGGPGGRPGGPGGPGGRPGGPGGPGGRPGGPGGPGGRPGGPGGPGGPAPGAAPEGDGRRRRKKDKRVVDFSKRDNETRFEMQGRGKKGKRGKRGGVEPQSTTQPIKAAKRKVRIEEAIRVADLAKQMGVKAQLLIKALFTMGMMATINQSLDFDTAVLIASDFGYEVEKVGFSEDDYIVPKEKDAPESLQDRAPVVTIMGHVDHGKTSLLDAIRESKITSGEAGGITQHIGAYDVTTPRGKIVFLDTPGHEAFTAMRARGAKVTDLVILVVAADDGVMDQTREAISHSKAAGVPIIVAVNKIDKEGADPDRVMRELADHDLVPEDWGGQTIFCNVSAKTGENLDTLLELVLLQAEVLELKANPDKPAVGHIVEARLDKGRGPVATVLIEAGTLNQGDCFVCGVQSGKVRAMQNDQGRKVKTVGPATPVEVQGFEGVPLAGDEFVCVEDEKVARRIAQNRALKQRERQLASESKVTLESFLASSPDSDVKTLNLLTKADVQGSQEAIGDALNKLSTDAVKVNILHSGAGAITESDILLAAASNAIIIGFNVRPTAKIKEIAEQEHVEIRFYDIIYKLVSEIKDAMAGMLAPIISEKYLGQAEVRDTFTVPKVGTIAGCFVVDGQLTRHAKVRLLREGVVIYTGALASLKRFKDDAKEVNKGYECGAGLERFNDIKTGDVIEAFTEVESAATLD
ncbi:translation initiation factor IF-2 [Desulfovibrio ferrophilus]|uniref:Translation initiation factor IF-2 n=1 Tax=Desulfovibrio ferrophilus TaxID=241368 RepID=A0A2Z6AXI5_9BACT|nr:translation initiation factor IF-2 [Desulfovibrio ferrophilus]BBD07918.1 translation initiation factor IF-2 [Desulfovibrio ferrophilus]